MVFRALSIFLVLAAHGFQFTKPHDRASWWLLAIAKNGTIGVSIFFVISGFLITSLLMREERKNGKISLRGFYFRRAFRIFPAFPAYVLFIAVMAGTGHIRVPASQFAWALSFAQDYNLHSNWFFVHLWSLSVEEQFYLLWPLLVLLCSKRVLIWIACTVIVCEPIIRLATRHFLPSTYGQIHYMGHTRADLLMFGCLAASVYENQTIGRWLRKSFHPLLPAVLLTFLTVISPVLQRWSEDNYLTLCGYTLQGVSITLLLWYAIENPQAPMIRWMNRPFATHIGVLSYSIYLWQQFFFAPPYAGLLHLAVPVGWAVLAAHVSYYVIERPFLRLRQTLERREPRELAGAGPELSLE